MVLRAFRNVREWVSFPVAVLQKAGVDFQLSLANCEHFVLSEADGDPGLARVLDSELAVAGGKRRCATLWVVVALPCDSVPVFLIKVQLVVIVVQEVICAGKRRDFVEGW